MRPTPGGPDQAALASLAALRARVALLDRHGVVIWSNPAWSRLRQRQSSDSLATAALGLNYIALCRRSTHAAALAIAEGVRAVLGQASRYFELDAALSGPPGHRTQITVTPAPDTPGGAVLVQTDVYGSSSVGRPEAPPAPLESATQAPLDLTPRERQVLVLMSRGHGNPEIAHELGVGYTTVRAHVRSLMAKLDARSRLGAVVRAVELGVIQLPGPVEAEGDDQRDRVDERQ